MIKSISSAALSLLAFAALSGPATAQGFYDGTIHEALGLNHEAQVAASCASQYGVSPTAAGCIVSQLTADEVHKCLSDGFGGRGCFGDNNTLVNMVQANIDAAQREQNVVDATIRATTGISPGDIREYGPLGGENSEARKACNVVAGLFGGSC